MGGHLFPLYTFSSRSSSSLLKPLTACLNYMPNIEFERYSSKREHKNKSPEREFIEERAPSTAEEFKRVAEEKLQEAEQGGVASQAFEKTYDGAEEATLGDSKVESVKNRYKTHEPGADYRRRPHDD